MIALLIKTQSISKASPEQLLRALGLDSSPSFDVDVAHVQTILTQQEAVKAVTEGVKVTEFGEKEYGEYIMTSRLLARELGMKPGERAVLVNGRVSIGSCHSRRTIILNAMGWIAGSRTD